MSRVKHNKNTILIFFALASFVMCSSVFAVTFEGPAGAIPNTNSQPDKFTAPTTDCNPNQFISFNQSDTPNYKCVDDRVSVSFTDVLRGLADSDPSAEESSATQQEIESGIIITVDKSQPFSRSAGGKLRITANVNGKNYYILHATENHYRGTFEGGDYMFVENGTNEEIASAIASDLPKFWEDLVDFESSLTEPFDLIATSSGNQVIITPTNGTEISSPVIEIQERGFSTFSVLEIKKEEFNALCEQNKFLAGFENGKIKCEDVSFAGITGFCLSGAAVSGVDIINGQKLYVCESADTLLNKTNVILDKALHGCETGNLIELKNGEVKCRKFIFESSYEPKLILQEKILAFRDAFCAEQTDASTILDGTKVLILTGFVGDDYSNNFNQAQNHTVVLPEIIKDFTGESVFDRYLKISDNVGDAGKIDVNNLSGNDFFGHDVDIDGNFIVVGAPGNKFGGAKRGAVYIFEKVNGVWEKGGLKSGKANLSTTELDGFENIYFPNIGSYDKFGSSVAVYGDILLVGAPGDDHGYSNAGVVHLFDNSYNNVGGWSHTGTLGYGNIAISGSSENYADSSLTGNFLNLSSQDGFGGGLDIYKDRFAVGAPGDDDGGSESGGVYTFRISEEGGYSVNILPEYFFTSGDGSDVDDTFVIQTIPDHETNTKYGEVALGDGILAVGAHKLDDSYTAAGGVFIYEEDESGNWSQTLKISNNTGSDGELDVDILRKDDSFGFSVDIYENILVVGSKDADDGGNNRGAVYTFIKNNGEWKKQYVISDNSSLTNTGLDGFTPVYTSLPNSNRFGSGVAVSQDGLVVGGQGDNSSKGSAYLFNSVIKNKDTQISTENGVITFNGKEDAGGEYLSVSDTDWSDVKSVSLWTKQEEEIEKLDTILEISDNTGGAGKLSILLGTLTGFAESVSYSEDTLVAGLHLDSIGGTSKGAVYIFEKDSSGVWSRTLQIADNGGGAGKLDVNLEKYDNFGRSVSYSDGKLFVGASGVDRNGNSTLKGAVYVFEKDSSDVWSKTLKISDNGGGTGLLDINLDLDDRFGESVSYSNGKLFVGSSRDDDGGTNKGAVYVFEKDSNDEWSQTLKISDNGGGNGLIDINLINNDFFGSSLSYSDEKLFVGAEFDDTAFPSFYNTNKGAVYVFEKDSGGEWSKTFKISDNEGGIGKLDVNLDTNDDFGSSLSYSDEKLFVGAPRDDDGGTNKGAVYVFEKDSSDVWSQTLKISDNGGGTRLIDVNLSGNDIFGSSVSYLDETLVVGLAGYSKTVFYNGVIYGGSHNGAIYIANLPSNDKIKTNPVFTFGSEDKNAALDFRKDATNNYEPSIHFDVASNVKTDTTVDVGLYIPTAAKSWNHIVIVNRGGGVVDIYRNNEFVGKKKTNDFPGLLSGFIGKNSTAVLNASIKELVVTKEELTDEQITSLYNHGLGVRIIKSTSIICDFTENGS